MIVRRRQGEPPLGTVDDSALTALADRVRRCRRCLEAPDGPALPHDPRPVLRVSTTARILVAGQAPGTRVHASGVPFSDRSGDRLRSWMGVTPAEFYDEAKIAILPMGFCFPGLDGNGSDLPPRRECARLWRTEIMAALTSVRLILAIGAHAIRWHLPMIAPRRKVGEIVACWREIEAVQRADRAPESKGSRRDLPMTSARSAVVPPLVFPLPHPSWRNSGWLQRNPWFETDLLTDLRARVGAELEPQTSTLGNRRTTLSKSA